MATRSLRALARAMSRPLVGGIVLAGSLSLAAEVAQAAPPSGQTIYTSRPKFRIPFQFDAEEMARLGAVEIRLFASTDAGRHWQHAQSVAPGEGRFTFEATGEGEYWFAVRTVDSQGQLHPPGPPQSGLQVVVDQTIPQLDIRVREVQPGEIELTWQAADDHLNLDSLKLEFLEAGGGDWQPVNITPAESGQTSWIVANPGRVSIRATVADKAENSATAEASTAGDSSPAQPAAQPNNDKPDFSRPVAGPAPLPNTPDNLAFDQAPVVIPNGSNEPLPSTQFPVSTLPAQVPVTPRAVSGPAQPPVVVETPEAFQATPTATETPEATAGVPTRHVRTRAFNVEYELEDVGPSGVSSVDLYITENNGAKWYHYGPDEDRHSPVPIELQKDGEYGFSLRVRSGAGIVQDPPQPGDPPSFVVVVDRQAPQAELVNVSSSQDGEITVEWTARDEQLASRPVRLSWAPTREGPWRAMTDWIPNTGRHQWRPSDEQALASVFLRMETRDAAGNIARVDSKSPLVLDSARPTARFTDVDSGAAVTPQ